MIFRRRSNNTGESGAAFDSSVIDAVWRKATIVAGVDPRYRRKDACGAWIDRNKYGDTVYNGYGWEIDHLIPVAAGGTDGLANLQPLHWQNNRAKGDARFGWICAVSAKR